MKKPPQIIKTEKPHKTSRKALRETEKMNTVNKHELPNDRQERSVWTAYRLRVICEGKADM